MEHPQKKCSIKCFILSIKDTNMFPEYLYDLVVLKGNVKDYLIIKNKSPNASTENPYLYDMYAFFKMERPIVKTKIVFPTPITVDEGINLGFPIYSSSFLYKIFYS